MPTDAQSDDAGSARPTVSVVIATYNRWPMVAETIESVLAQTFNDYEIVVVDDGSPDGSADLLEAAYPSVRVIRQTNSERGAAINHGIRLARGRYVAFLGDDDIFESWHLQQFADALTRYPDIELFASRAALWDPDSGRCYLLQGFDPDTLRRDSLMSTIVVIQSMIVSRDALLAVGGLPEDRSLVGCEDWVLLVKLSRRYQPIRLVRPSVRIRQHPGRSMNNVRVISESRETATRMIFQENLLGFELNPDEAKLLIASTHRISAAHLYAAGSMREARSRLGDVRHTLGFGAGTRWTARMWLQTWLGPTGSDSVRRLKQRLTWR